MNKKRGRKPFDRKGRKVTHYWLYPATRVKVKQMAAAWKKPVAHVMELLVDRAYEIFKK